MSKRHVYLSMPSYGNICAGAARGFFRASKAENIETHLHYDQGSLLATNFNQHWCWALNAAVAHNRQVHYFAMLHADVQPEDYWLDKLIAEMESHNLDVVSALVPIKDPHGLTSTALGNPGDSWRVATRITMREAFNMPETFTAADIGHHDKILLMNTGCWICRFDLAWAKPPFHFEINDRIVWDAKRGLFVPEVEPEDWNISRRFHDLGLRVGVTRKVMLAHRGEMNFLNTQPWGDYTHDREYTDQSIFATGYYQKEKPADWKFPDDVDGWLTEREGIALAKLSKGKRVLEIGSYCGKSTICMAQTARDVTVVDPFDGRATPRPRDTMAEFDFNLNRYGVSAHSHGRGTIDEIGPYLESSQEPFELIFIDGAHDKESVANDIQWALRLLSPDGLLAFHDYKKLGDEGVTEAVDEFLADSGKLIETHDSLAVCKPELVLN